MTAKSFVVSTARAQDYSYGVLEKALWHGIPDRSKTCDVFLFRPASGLEPWTLFEILHAIEIGCSSTNFEEVCIEAVLQTQRRR